jgi:hypothetical protein
MPSARIWDLSVHTDRTPATKSSPLPSNRFLSPTKQMRREAGTRASPFRIANVAKGAIRVKKRSVRDVSGSWKRATEPAQNS